MLFVEDDQETIDQTKEVLENRGWKVDVVTNGENALRKIKEDGSIYDIIVLDLRLSKLDGELSKLDGEQILEVIQDINLRVPPIIVLSAYITPDVVMKCRYLGAVHVLSKPYNPAFLSNIALTASKGTPIVNTPLEFDDSLLDYMVRRRKESLSSILLEKASGGIDIRRFEEPIFIVGRRWNSWYPSIFPVPGGAYAIIAPPTKDNNIMATSKGKGPGVIIDPGFRSLEVFRNMGVPWVDFSSCVITHNHPDHMAGVFELMAARNVIGERTRAFCSRSCCEMLGNCSGFNLEIKQLGENYADLIPSYLTYNNWLRIRVKGFDTAHEEIGRANSSQGLHITIERGPTSDRLDVVSELVLVGDTEYDRSEHRDNLIPTICKQNIKYVILHIGCSQLRQATGKHLYLGGLRNILADMHSQLIVSKYQGIQTVLVSEWGLEHATRGQIEKVCGQTLPGFNDYSPIIETIRSLQKGLKKLRLVPADIGLTFGLESGKVYIGMDEPISMDELSIDLSEDGLIYGKKILPISSMME